MRCARVAVTREWVLSKLRQQEKNEGGPFDIPEDSIIVDAEYNAYQRVFILTLASKNFSPRQEIRPGDPIMDTIVFRR